MHFTIEPGVPGLLWKVYTTSPCEAIRVPSAPEAIRLGVFIGEIGPYFCFDGLSDESPNECERMLVIQTTDDIEFP